VTLNGTNAFNTTTILQFITETKNQWTCNKSMYLNKGSIRKMRRRMKAKIQVNCRSVERGCRCYAEGRNSMPSFFPDSTLHLPTNTFASLQSENENGFLRKWISFRLSASKLLNRSDLHFLCPLRVLRAKALAYKDATEWRCGSQVGERLFQAKALLHNLAHLTLWCLKKRFMLTTCIQFLPHSTDKAPTFYRATCYRNNGYFLWQSSRVDKMQSFWMVQQVVHTATTAIWLNVFNCMNFHPPVRESIINGWVTHTGG
jgi:hypothetical protein